VYIPVIYWTGIVVKKHCIRVTLPGIFAGLAIEGFILLARQSEVETDGRMKIDELCQVQASYMAFPQLLLKNVCTFLWIPFDHIKPVRRE
jgi:hypothetical protein